MEWPKYVKCVKGLAYASLHFKQKMCPIFFYLKMNVTLFIAISVTRLGDFWKILSTNFLTKVAKIIGDFGAIYNNGTFYVKMLWLITFVILGLLFIATFAHSDSDQYLLGLMLGGTMRKKSKAICWLKLFLFFVQRIWFISIVRRRDLSQFLTTEEGTDLKNWAVVVTQLPMVGFDLGISAVRSDHSANCVKVWC